MKRESTHQQVATAMNEGWLAGGGFFASIMSGFLLGFIADRIFGLDPVLTVSGIVAGSISGFTRMWIYAREQGQRER